jgi:hypothetical protein
VVSKRLAPDRAKRLLCEDDSSCGLVAGLRFGTKSAGPTRLPHCVDRPTAPVNQPAAPAAGGGCCIGVIRWRMPSVLRRRDPHRIAGSASS